MTNEDTFDGPSGSTPLDEEEKEQLNILAGTLWLDGSRMKAKDLFTTKRIQLVHRRMFDRVWKRAVKFRRSNDEIAVRFHHRLVAIHPFVNGNGRHARLVRDKLLSILGEKEFTWGQSSLDRDGDARQRYIRALKTADRHDYAPLLAFART